jgi:hypothetical protein
MINIVNIEAVEDKIHVTVSIQEYCNAKNRHIIICDTGDVIKALAEKKVKIGKCIKSRRLCNTRIKNCQGLYIFEKPAPRRAPAPKPSPITAPAPSNKTKRTVKKVSKNINKKLDNS